MTGGADLTRPRHIRHSEQKPEWGVLPGSLNPGTIRGGYPRVDATNAFARMMILPLGQGAPAHTNTAEHLIVHLQGSVTFEFPKSNPGELFRLEPHDLLFIPANEAFAYFNSGKAEAVWVSILTTAGVWPPSGSPVAP
jgi:mannose-6-phosphate isomerase-like protein (cupin superfamily)